MPSTRSEVPNPRVPCTSARTSRQSAQARNEFQARYCRRRLSKYPLLIIDEWAARTIRPDEAHFLFDLVERRYGNSSMLLCTQHPMREWHALLGGDATADSIMDRLVQNAIQVYTGETNMRQLLSPHPLRPEDNP